MTKLSVFTIGLLSSFSALAEYRVYQYLVKTTDPYAVATKAQARFVASTLNPKMFNAYHGGSWVTADLMRTWMCPGDTSREATCPHPYDQEVKKP
jgi:hypothetical protein